MKKFNLLMAGALFGLMLLSACSDGLLDESSTSNAEAPALDASKDLTYGCNLFISGADTLDQQRIALNTTEPVKVTCEEGKITFECVKENGRYFLKPVMLAAQTSPSMVDKVTLSVEGNASLSKDLYVSVRQPMTTRAASKDPVIAKLARIFSYGMYPCYEIGTVNARYVALDTAVLTAQDPDKGNLSPIQTVGSFQNKFLEYDAHGSSSEEINKEIGFNVGFNAPIPAEVYGHIINLSGKFGYTSTQKSESYYEYAQRDRFFKCAAGAINYNTISDLSKFISYDLNRILNCDYYGVNNYYDNSAEGIFHILDDFGVYLPSYCVLGAGARYTMSKKQDLEMSGSEWNAQLTVALTNSKTDPNMKDQTGITKDNLEVYKWVNENAPKVSADFHYKNETTVKNADVHAELEVYGGSFASVNSIETFTASDKPNNWVAVRYDDNGQDAQLKPLYDFVIDKTSTRYKQLKKYIEENPDSVAAYYKHKGTYLDSTRKKQTSWVLAGLKLRVMNNDDQVTPIEEVCPDGVKRTFYPMMCNKRATRDNRYSDMKGKTLDTETSDFGRCVRAKKHVWYYALALADDCPGIKSIEFHDEEQGGDWHNCDMPTTANTGDGWRCATDDKYLEVLPIKKGDEESKPITAFAFYDDEGNIISSTGGTEYQNSGNREKFNTFWIDDDRNDNQGEKYLTKPNDPTKCGIYFLHLIHQPVYLKYMYSTRPLILGTGADKHMIEHPSDMQRGGF